MSQGGQQPSGELRDETRGRILSGARQAISVHGLRRVGMSDVSEAAGVSRGTLYRYFPGREELLDALSEYEQQVFLEGLKKTVAEAGDGSRALEAAVSYILVYVRTHPALRRVLETDPRLVLDTLRFRLPELQEGTRSLIVPLVVQAGGGALAPEAAGHFSDWLVRLVVSEYLMPDPREGWVEEAVGQLLQLVTHGQAGKTEKRKPLGAKRTPTARSAARSASAEVT